MKTISKSLPGFFEYAEYQISYALRDVVLPQDLSLLIKWMHQPHIIPQWQLNKSELELAVYFERMLCDDHQHLYIVQIDGQDVGYLEIYEAKRDRLALYYDAKADDLGWHVLLSEDAVGKGHFRAVMRMLSFLIFEHSNAEKVVGEPDLTMSVYERVRQDIALEPQGLIHLQEKTAMLYHCFREKFYQQCGHYYEKFKLKKQAKDFIYFA
ncbi:GNAT family N-acetyltransferase [Acinetobacter soli]|uniref:GNAT family N-acetyltransferase n=1 Tax=Acinetobacter soli TaxID=487316 RepID=UPI00124FB9D8|nr:GNAT family N-acetyltransferase [Acinetobacter soli]